MAYIRRKTTKSTTEKKKITCYEIDGFKYKSKTLLEYHKELSQNSFVTSFHLPELEEDKAARCAKFNSYKVSINNIEFDSIMESRFYLRLLDMQHKKRVIDFKMQHTFDLQPSFKDKFTGKTIRAITYIADFVVTMNDKNKTVLAIDVKGKETEVFRVKKKLFQYKYPDIRLMCMRWVSKKNDWFELSELK